MSPSEPPAAARPGLTHAVVHAFLHSNLSVVLILLAAALGLAALLATPREEDPQIVVPLADVYVSFPGHGAEQVEQLVTTPLEKLLYQIDGVEYVYSMSRPEQAVLTVRFFVGQDRERSLVKLYKRIDEHLDLVPPGVTGWVVKPVEIDDVPIVTLTLTSTTADEFLLRRLAEELSERLASVENLSRAYVTGGLPRQVYVYLDPDRLEAHQTSPLQVARALEGANVRLQAGRFAAADRTATVEVGRTLTSVEELRQLVISVFDGHPVVLRDVAEVVDGASEVQNYVRHAWGPARGFADHEGGMGTLVGATPGRDTGALPESRSAVTIAIAKKKGTNAVWVARDVLRAAEALRQEVLPDDVELVITRNTGLVANDKVNELIEALAVAVVIVIALLTLGLGWRESLIVAVAVPVVFGLALTVNLLAGYTINRVTLFALILSLGLLVDDPIVDVENITRHFAMRGRATRDIVLEAVAEIRPPLITATLAVIVSFLPLFFITGMMGPYMRPMALNVPVTMFMSMLVAFTITPWLSYHLLRKKYAGSAAEAVAPRDAQAYDPEAVKASWLYRLFFPLMSPLLGSRGRAWAFLGVVAVLTALAAALAATRHVPLKMLPFDNKNELHVLLDLPEGSTLERTDAAVRDLEHFLQTVPEVTDVTSYVGLASPMDFNGLVRHYYLRRGDHVADLRINLVGKKNRRQQSHALGLRIRDDLRRIAGRYGAVLKVVELPPGPPVLASIVAEVYGREDQTYGELIDAARVVRRRLEREPSVVDVDDSVESDETRLRFVVDQQKAALNGVSVEEIANTVRMSLAGYGAGLLEVPAERNPLRIEVRLPRFARSSIHALSRVHVQAAGGASVPLVELGAWSEATLDKTIYHKNLQRVVYVFAETAGRPPADVVVDVQADRLAAGATSRPGHGIASHGSPTEAATDFGGWVADAAPRPVEKRTFLRNGGGIAWRLSDGIRVAFAGEGEWKITLDVFRDLGLAFGAALAAIYILLVAQTGSFALPLVVMLAIPLTVLGIMPGFWLLNVVAGREVAGYMDPVFFTATGMIGMIALAGIVTRDSIILVDFIHLALARGRSLRDAILESRVVRLRPILLTAGTAMLSAAPITIDPIFSGLAWSLIFGLFASTLFTLFVIPITYWLIYARTSPRGQEAS